jgi:hypothetical protein
VKDGKTTMARTKRSVTATWTSPAAAGEPVEAAREVVGGVDTHKDTHTAAVVDIAGRMLGHAIPEASTQALRHEAAMHVTNRKPLP